MKYKFAYFILVLLYISWIDSLGINPPPYTVLTLDNPAPGYLFMDSYNQGVINLVDNSGVPIYVKEMNVNDGIMNFTLQPNGMLTFFLNKMFYAVDENYSIIDSFSCMGNYMTDFHAFLITPDGNVFLIGQDNRIVDMSVLIPGGKKDAMVMGNVIQEFDRNKNLIFQWSTFDHYKITDVTSDSNLKMQTFEFAHINSICVDNDGNIIISARVLDEITKINSKTGDIMWRLGGKACKNNQFKIIGDTIDGFLGFSHQHSVSRLPNGNILMYDNGDLRPKQFSRAVEYSIDEANKTATLVWQYRPSPDIYSFAMGSVQRLDNGNTLIGWGINNRLLMMTEVFPNGSKAMEISSYNYQTYGIYRFPIKMAANENYIKKPGRYDFFDSLNQTGVSLDVYSSYGAGYVSVERHYYLPYNLSFVSSTSMGTYPNRWVLNNKGITKVDAIIKFDLSKNINIDPLRTIIAFRLNEGTGQFLPLETHYNSEDNTLEANIQSFGEFILCSPKQIETPILNYPPNNDSVTHGTTVTLSWNPISTDSRYRCQISKDSTFNEIALDSANINDSWLTYHNLKYGIKYFWRVKAISDTLESDWSDIWCFITAPKQVLDAPTLMSPYFGETDVPVNGYLQWSPVDGATFYNIELSTSPDFQSLTLKRNDITTQTLNYNNLDYNSIYYWHINASNDAVSSLWSNIWNFTTGPVSSVNFKSEIRNVYLITNSEGIVTFNLKLENPCTVSIVVYDIFGTEEAKVIKTRPDTGEIIVSLNTGNLTNGVYFYRIIAGSEFFQGKFMVTK